MKWLVNGLNWVATKAGSLFARRAPVVIEETVEQVTARNAARVEAAGVVEAEARAAGVRATTSKLEAEAAMARRASRGQLIGSTVKTTAVVGAGAVVANNYLASRETKKDKESTGNPVVDAFNNIKEFVTENLGFGLGSLIGAGALAILGGFVGPVVAIAGALLGMFIGQPIFENISAAFKQSPTDPNAQGTATAGNAPAEQQAPELAVNLQANLPSRAGDNPSRTNGNTRTT